MTRLLLTLLFLLSACTIATAQTPVPSPPADDPVLQACEACGNRLKLAETTLVAVQQQLLDARDIIAAKNKLLEQANGIITRYEKMTENSSTIQSNSGRIEKIDDTRVNILQTQLGEAQSKLDRCRGAEKYIAGGSFIAGIFVDRQFLQHGTPGSSLFSLNGAAPAQQINFAQAYPLSFYGETRTEKALRSILKQR